MRKFLIIAALSCVAFAVHAQDAQPPAPAPEAQPTAPPAQALPPASSKAPDAATPFVITHPIPLDQKKFDEAAAAYDAKDYDKAYKLFTELADEYDIAAMRNVALMTRDGLGTKKDPEKAEDMMREAAKRGLVNAQADLGVMLLDGAAGDPDPKAALPWLEMAASAGHPVAEYRLAQLYEAGDAVPKDMGVAEVLYAEAAKHGVPGALDRLKTLKGWKETPKELLPDQPPPEQDAPAKP
ncbi:MAG TPA: tetratricopeptide repeat protein [Rhizomicrobium sp.]|nr:tetratricopeptide repeat protein [Rhizomicrobium sp.]